MDLTGIGEIEWVGVAVAPFIGSFVGAAAERLARGEGFITGRSHCDSCHATLSIPELLPIISWIVLRGRCHRCNSGIGWWPLFSEFAFLLVACVTIAIASGPVFWIGCLLGWILLTLALIDLKTFLLPDALTFGLVASGLCYTAAFGIDVLFDRALATILGFASLFLVRRAYRILTNRDGLGLGDVKLFAAAGAWLGLEALPLTMLCAVILALVLAVVRNGGRGALDPMMPIAFGPYLAFAIWVGWIAEIYP